jgi:biopolymer transport protein ExbD
MNAAQVRAKARMAVKRREEEIETDEIESGELNLVPYLDIVTNVMLFLLATITSGLLIGTINSALPEYAQGPGGNGDTPDETPIQLVVAVGKSEVKMFSLSGMEGTLEAPKVKVPAITPGMKYDFTKITEAATEIVNTRWKGLRILNMDDANNPRCLDAEGKSAPLNACRPKGAIEVILMVDGEIPYDVVIGAMDSLRQNPEGLILFPGVIFSSGVQGG